MNKKRLGLVGGILLLAIGGIAVFNLNGENSVVELFKSPKQKQLEYLKQHEQEIIAWMISKYPKIESVQFDWDTLRVGPISNGIVTIGYNLSVDGIFNNNLKTEIAIDFFLDKADDIPDIRKIRMNHPPGIYRDGGLYIYE